MKSALFAGGLGVEDPVQAPYRARTKATMIVKVRIENVVLGGYIARTPTKLTMIVKVRIKNGELGGYIARTRAKVTMIVKVRIATLLGHEPK